MYIEAMYFVPLCMNVIFCEILFIIFFTIKNYLETEFVTKQFHYLDKIGHYIGL